jgi:hypothetical protein
LPCPAYYIQYQACFHPLNIIKILGNKGFLSIRFINDIR